MLVAFPEQYSEKCLLHVDSLVKFMCMPADWVPSECQSGAGAALIRVTQIRQKAQHGPPWRYPVCCDAYKLPTYTTCNWNSVLFQGSRRLSRPVICQEPLCPVRRGGVTTVAQSSGLLHPMQLNSCRLLDFGLWDVATHFHGKF